MADNKITALTEDTTPSETDLLVTVDDPGGSPVNKKATIANVTRLKKTDNVSATDKVLGRATAGAGAIEEIACTAAGRALIDDANAAAQLVTLGALPLAGGTMTGSIVSSSNPLFKYNSDADGTILAVYHTDGTTRKWQIDSLSHDFEVYMEAAAAYVFKILTNGNIWGIGDISGLSFTDRTPVYEGDAVAELIKVKGIAGKIDHSTLPAFARHVTTLQVASETEKGEDGRAVMVETQEEGRDLGAMISMLTVAIKQLNDRLLAVEKKY